jgi:hypothetical protein
VTHKFRSLSGVAFAQFKPEMMWKIYKWRKKIVISSGLKRSACIMEVDKCFLYLVIRSVARSSTYTSLNWNYKHKSKVQLNLPTKIIFSEAKKRQQQHFLKPSVYFSVCSPHNLILQIYWATSFGCFKASPSLLVRSFIENFNCKYLWYIVLHEIHNKIAKRNNKCLKNDILKIF